MSLPVPIPKPTFKITSGSCSSSSSSSTPTSGKEDADSSSSSTMDVEEENHLPGVAPPTGEGLDCGGSGDAGQLSPRKILGDSSSANIPVNQNLSNGSGNAPTSGDRSNNNNGGVEKSGHGNITGGVDDVDRRHHQNEGSGGGGGGRSMAELDHPNYLFKPMGKQLLIQGKPPHKLSEFREIHDLTRLDCITLENVLECLRERYRCQQYYTYAGPVLLSLNSCQRLPRASVIEDVSRMSWYFIKDSKASSEEKENDTSLEKDPHVYDIGQQCLKNLVTVGSHQIVLISGESGAGKTTATQQLIKYLTENNSRNFGATLCSNLDKKIYFATMILESFGNAKTQQNPNSSRFGRLVQLNYEQKSGRISGAEIQTYLLEKHRVAKYDYRCERSFHIFYYILLGLRNGALRLPNNVAWGTFKGFTPDHLIFEALDCEDEEVERLKNAIQAFNMDREFSEIVTVLCAMITLLNVVFVPDCDSSSEEEHYGSSSECPSRTEFTVSDRNCAQLAADLLGVRESELVDILIARKITAGNSHRHSIFRKPCERQVECEERLHALTSFIYDRLFSHVLDHLNTSLKGDSEFMVDGLSTLSLLDLYGFENFNINHLEQICINYANERLQQINVSIMKSYYEQSASVDDILATPTELNKIENEVRDRIEELHSCIFAFLDEECLLKRVSEDKDVLERMNMNLTAKKSKFIRAARPHESFKFTVSHYATNVEYQLTGMVQKNKDHIPPEFQDILKSSTNPFVHNLFKYELIRSRNASAGATPRSPFTVSSNKNSRGKTILTRFKTSVEDLMNRLKSTENNDIHFIRCIRPNADLLAGTFSMNLVEKQLHACGIADVVKIAGNGYPIRIRSSKFLKEFPKVISYFCNGSLNNNTLSLVFYPRANMKPLKFGKNMIFMTEESWKCFKKTEKFLALHNARIIQKAWKKFLERKEMMKQALTQELARDSSVIRHSPELDSMDRGSWTNSMQIMDSMDMSDIIDVSNSSQGYFSKLRMSLGNVCRPPLYFGSGVASRAPVHTLPIKIYMKRTCLPFVEKPPRRLMANGISDAFEDYGIIFFKT